MIENEITKSIELTEADLENAPIRNGKIILNEEMLEPVAGGGQNIDPNTGEYITDPNKFNEWFNSTRNKTYQKVCPYCGRFRYDCTWGRTCTRDLWYMFWYNRLYCYRAKVWSEELY